ncbi:MAG: hypothetical protein QM704_24815 [Anaeromyxobacteraceae bacterium]
MSSSSPSRALLAALLVAAGVGAAAPARAATHRLLLAVGANVGEPDDPVLSYADDDAQRVRQVLVELGGVRPDRALVVLDREAGEVRKRLSELAGRISELRAAGDDAVLFVYVSSHAKDGVLRLGGSRLALADLREAARDAGARVTVLVVDACESGALARRKGARPGPEFAVSLEQLPVRGEVFISSSGPGESSEEWDSLKGSLFTHHLLTGLRGDADVEGDGRVSLSEVYAYAYRRTVAGAAGAGQHPAFAFDLAGSGELVLTEPVQAHSALVFPAALSGRYVVASQPRPDVVAEVEKPAGKPLRLAVPPGRYLVRKRAGASTGLLELELPFGGEREVRDQELAWRRYQEVAVKGGYLSVRNAAVVVLGAVQTSPLAGTGSRWAGAAGYRHTAGPWWALATIGAGAASYPGVELTVDERRLGLGLAAGYRWLEWPVVPHLGLAVEVAGVEQRPVRAREREIRDTFGVGPLPLRRALGLSAGLTAGLEVPLPGALFGWFMGELMWTALPTERDAGAAATRGVRAGLGWRL